MLKKNNKLDLIANLWINNAHLQLINKVIIRSNKTIKKNINVIIHNLNKDKKNYIKLKVWIRMIKNVLNKNKIKIFKIQHHFIQGNYNLKI